MESVGLFNGLEYTELKSVLSCLDAEIKEVPKNEIILLAGDKPKYVGAVLAGAFHIVREDYDGNRSILAAVTPGEVFAETLCCANVAESPVTVVADIDSTVLLLDIERIVHTCPNSCVFHSKLIRNLLGLIADKNLYLQNRMEIISLKSIRTKVIRYLESISLMQKEIITIPYNREELADFLCVDRSALSHELSRMKKDRLIDYHKNKFVIM